MVVINQAPAGWDPASVTLYQTNDSALGSLPLLIFYGSSTTTNSTLNSSRIQAHIFSIAGHRSYPRLTVSPTSPLYEAVRHLPEEKQGDEASRGLAISIFKYFGELPSLVRQHLTASAAYATASPMFDAAHAARLVTNLVQTKDAIKVTSQLMAALAEKHVSWVDVDVMVSQDAAKQLKARSFSNELDSSQLVANEKRGPIMELLDALGSPAFLPTSKLRRAPSRPTGMSKTKSLSPTEVEALQREMMEATDTEVAYVKKLQELDQVFASAEHQPEETAAARYPDAYQRQRNLIQSLVRTLREISHLNGEFLNSIVDIMDETSSHANYGQPNSATPGRHDITGAEAFAKVLLLFLPRFNGPYQQYLKLSPQIPRLLSASNELGISTVTSAIAQIGEKRLKSWLIEPVQRLPRYTLFVDKMIGLLPSSHPAVNKFLRAKDLIADICALDSEESDSDGVVIRRLRELVSQLPSNLSSVGRLIAAADALELQPPYRSVSSDGQGTPCILLLFAGMIVILKKSTDSTLTARGLLAEVQRPGQVPSTLESEPDANVPQQHFVFDTSLPVEIVTVNESDHGRDIFLDIRRDEKMGMRQPKGEAAHSNVIKAYCLQGSYEGKATKLVEEIVRARIETRFSEFVRDGPTWTFRILPPEHGRIGMALAIFDPNVPLEENLFVRGRGTIVVDVRGTKEVPRPGAQKTIYESAEIDLRVSTLDSNVLRLEGTTADGRRFIDQATAPDLISQILKRGK
jgi:RhoGEF domain/Domain of unknown function (DUF3507)